MTSAGWARILNCAKHLLLSLRSRSFGLTGSHLIAEGRLLEAGVISSPLFRLLPKFSEQVISCPRGKFDLLEALNVFHVVLQYFGLPWFMMSTLSGDIVDLNIILASSLKVNSTSCQSKIPERARAYYFLNGVPMGLYPVWSPWANASLLWNGSLSSNGSPKNPSQSWNCCSMTLSGCRNSLQ